MENREKKVLVIGVIGADVGHAASPFQIGDRAAQARVKQTVFRHEEPPFPTAPRPFFDIQKQYRTISYQLPLCGISDYLFFAARKRLICSISASAFVP